MLECNIPRSLYAVITVEFLEVELDNKSALQLCCFLSLIFHCPSTCFYLQFGSVCRYLIEQLNRADARFPGSHPWIFAAILLPNSFVTFMQSIG